MHGRGVLTYTKFEKEESLIPLQCGRNNGIGTAQLVRRKTLVLPRGNPAGLKDPVWTMQTYRILTQELHFYDAGRRTTKTSLSSLTTNGTETYRH